MPGRAEEFIFSQTCRVRRRPQEGKGVKENGGKQMSTLLFVIKVGILGVLATVGCMFMGMGIAYFFDNLEKGRNHK